MKKAFLILIIIPSFVIFNLTLVILVGPAFADKLEGGGYILYDVINSGGMTLQQGDNVLKDSKGDGIAGRSGAGIYIFTPGLFGLMATGEIEFIPPVPTGTVLLRIARDNQDIKLSWDPLIIQPEIYAMAGDGSGKYDLDQGWTLVYQNGSIQGGLPPNLGTFALGGNPNEILHQQQVGAGTALEVYYKALEKGINPATVHPDAQYGGATYLAVAWAVGKINVDIAKDGEMKLIGLPLAAGKVSDVFVGQLAPNQEIILLPRTGGGLDYITATTSTVTGNDFDIDPTVGFWLRNSTDSDITVTFAGSLVNYYTAKNLVKFDLTGNPLALAFPSAKLGVDGDIVLPQTGSGLDYFVKSGGSWGPNFPSLNFTSGFWYKYSTNDRRWAIEPLNLDAVIEQY